MNSYSKSEIKNGFYITTRVVETIESSKEIVPAEGTFKVLATGAYGQIKVTDEVREYTLTNPFSIDWKDELVDRRDTDVLVLAHSKDFDKTLDMKVATFDLSPEIMANLHYKIFMDRKNDEYWVELTQENLSLCI